MGVAALTHNTSLQVSEASRSLLDSDADSAQDYILVQHRVRELMSDDYDVTRGERPPSEENLERVLEFIRSAFRRSRFVFPRGFASTTGQGDIRVYWRSEPMDLHLIFGAGASTAPSLYVRDGDTESFNADATPVDLADSLSLFSRA